jgi:hypothetical protein
MPEAAGWSDRCAVYRLIGLAVATLCGIGPVMAMGEISCTVEGNDMHGAIRSGLDGAGMAFVGLRGELDVTPPDTPRDFRHTALSPQFLTHSWIDTTELKLMFYRERAHAPFGALELRVETRWVESDRFEGQATITIRNVEDKGIRSVSHTGKARCFAD